MVALGETILDQPAAAASSLSRHGRRDRCARCVETTGGPGTAPLVNNLYQGMAQDPVTGLYYERARWYSPSLGTWISQDPAGYINGADTYQFVMENPISRVDATGRMCDCSACRKAWEKAQIIAAKELTAKAISLGLGGSAWGIVKGAVVGGVVRGVWGGPWGAIVGVGISGVSVLANMYVYSEYRALITQQLGFARDAHDNCMKNCE